MGRGDIDMWSFSHLIIFSPLRSWWYLDWCCIYEKEKTNRKQDFSMILASVRLLLVGWWFSQSFTGVSDSHRVITLYFGLLFMYPLLLIAWVTKRKGREILAALALLNVSCSPFWRRIALVGEEKQQSPPVVLPPWFVTLISACPNSLGVAQSRVKSYPNSKFRWRVQAHLLPEGAGAQRFNTQLGCCSMQGERSTSKCMVWRK